MNEMLEIKAHLRGLNEQQREAVLCDADIVYVEAGPGTGKTHMLTSKLLEFVYSSTKPQKIVALSYTNTAARQLGERFDRKLAESGRTAEFSFFNGTIHSFCYRMLKAYSKEAARLFDYVILDEEEIQELAEEIRKSKQEPVPIQQILSCLRSDRRDIPDGLFEEVARIKEAFKVISMQDILANYMKALDTDVGFQDWIRGQVSVIAIDEAQDLTELYYSIIDRMISIIPGLKVFLVGDPRQNIFEFNGGSYSNLTEFLSKHRSHVTKHLSITYRCPQCVADYVNTFAFSDCDNTSLRSSCETTGNISFERVLSESDEANMVIRGVTESGSLGRCAVLSNNLCYLGTLIDRLCDLGIPYKVFGGRRLVKRHVRFLNHIFRIIDSDNAYSISKVASYAGIDIRGMDGRRSRKLFFESDLGILIDKIRNESSGRPFKDMMEMVIERIMRDSSDDESVTRDYELLLALSEDYKTVSDYLLAFATDKERFSPFFKSDYRECPVDNSGEFLTISTIHSAKGLEWDRVYIVGLCEGNFPNDYFCKDLSDTEKGEYFNAEWKKMYVASTRARESLTLTCPMTIKRKGYTFRKMPSRFIVSHLPVGSAAVGAPVDRKEYVGRNDSVRAYVS